MLDRNGQFADIKTTLSSLYEHYKGGQFIAALQYIDIGNDLSYWGEINPKVK